MAHWPALPSGPPPAHRARDRAARPGGSTAQVLVRDRPRRRDAVVVRELSEVLGAQTVERRAVELGGAADAVVDLRLERPVALVVPRVLRHVAVVDKDVVR